MGNGRAWVNSMDGNGLETHRTAGSAEGTADGKPWSEPINITEQVQGSLLEFFFCRAGERPYDARRNTGISHSVYRCCGVPNAGIMYRKRPRRDLGNSQSGTHPPYRGAGGRSGAGVLMLNCAIIAEAVVRCRLRRTWGELD